MDVVSVILKYQGKPVKTLGGITKRELERGEGVARDRE